MRNWLIKIATSVLLCLSLALSSIGFLSMSAFAGTPDNDLPTAPAAVKVNNFTIINATTVEPLSDPYTCSIGDIITLDVIFSPENAEAKYKKVVWESNTPDAIGIEAIEGSDTQAKITAKKLGRYEITATVTNNEADAKKWITKSLTINVNQPPPVESIKLGKSTLEMTKSTQEKLTATVSPASADQTVTWTSSATNVAAVNEEGLVVASETNTGTATITATAGDKTATCTVTVCEAVVITNTEAPKKITNYTNLDPFQKGVFTVTFDNKGGSCSNFQNTFGWYLGANNATTTVTSTDEQNITIKKCIFYTKNGSAEVTESPFTVYSWYDRTFTKQNGSGTSLYNYGVTKIEVYFTRNA